MNPVDQTEFGDLGNCVSACIASILEISIKEVPHFLLNKKGEPDEAGAYFRMDDWLKSRGFFRRRFVCYPGWEKDITPIGFHMIGGPSPRLKNLGHMVVGFEGKLVHDPHPSRAGLSGSPEEFEFIVNQAFSAPKEDGTNEDRWIKENEWKVTCGSCGKERRAKNVFDRTECLCKRQPPTHSKEG